MCNERVAIRQQRIPSHHDPAGLRTVKRHATQTVAVRRLKAGFDFREKFFPDHWITLFQETGKCFQTIILSYRSRNSKTTTGSVPTTHPAVRSANCCYADAEAIVKKPVAVYVEKVYEEGDYSTLGIGT